MSPLIQLHLHLRLADPIETGIIEGPENPVAHYFNNGEAQRYPNLNNDTGTPTDMTVSCIEQNGLHVDKHMQHQTR